MYLVVHSLGIYSSSFMFSHIVLALWLFYPNSINSQLLHLSLTCFPLRSSKSYQERERDHLWTIWIHFVSLSLSLSPIPPPSITLSL